MDVGESPAAAAVREAREEISADVQLVRLVDVLGGPDFEVSYPTATGPPTSPLSMKQCRLACDCARVAPLSGQPPNHRIAPSPRLSIRNPCRFCHCRDGNGTDFFDLGALMLIFRAAGRRDQLS